jgi:nitrile hydratase
MFADSMFIGSETSFRGAQFLGYEVSFANSTFGADETSFEMARFSGHEVTFDHALFTGGDASFRNSAFDAENAWFERTHFGSSVTFNNASFSGRTTWFVDASFAGEIAEFAGTKFGSAHTLFARAKFVGTSANFSAAHFRGASLSFGQADFSSDVTDLGGIFDIQHNSFEEALINGKRIVVKAWNDPDFAARVVSDTPQALAEVELSDSTARSDLAHLRAVANSSGVHHLVVCTFNSLFPWPMLATPPSIYGKPNDRRYAASEPRRFLIDRRIDLPDDTEVKVCDPTAQSIWFVIPERPVDTEDLSDAELMELVTEAALMGLARAGRLALP